MMATKGILASVEEDVEDVTSIAVLVSRIMALFRCGINRAEGSGLSKRTHKEETAGVRLRNV